MTSKTKALKKGKYTPGTAKPAPAKKAETKNTTKVVSNKHIARSKRKEIEARSRLRRIRSLLKAKVPKEQIEEWLHEEDSRFVLCLIYDSFSIEDEGKKLFGTAAFEKFCEQNQLKIISSHKGGFGHAGWILSDKNNVDSVVEQLTSNKVGRVSVTKPEKHTAEPVKRKKDKKPTNNTTEVKKAAKTARKEAKKSDADMRPYYAALRKGGVSERIKKYNKTLAEKIEKWLKERATTKTSRKKGSIEERAKHRQLTSIEMKANKRARKAAKFLATQERRKEAEKKRMEANAKLYEKRVKKAKKPVQTELKDAA